MGKCMCDHNVTAIPILTVLLFTHNDDNDLNAPSAIKGNTVDKNVVMLLAKKATHYLAS